MNNFFANDWIWSAVLWCRMRPLYQVSHNHSHVLIWILVLPVFVSQWLPSCLIYSKGLVTFFLQILAMLFTLKFFCVRHLFENSIYFFSQESPFLWLTASQSVVSLNVKYFAEKIILLHIESNRETFEFSQIPFLLHNFDLRRDFSAKTTYSVCLHNL